MDEILREYLGDIDDSYTIKSVVTYESETRTEYENFIIPDGVYITKILLIVACAVYLLKGVFSLIRGKNQW